MRLGIIGCGAIGTDVALAADDMEEIEEIYLHDKNRDAERHLVEKVRKGKAVTVNEMLKKVDAVFEAASQQAVKEYGIKVLSAGRDLVIMSMGALFDDKLWQGLVKTAKEKRCKIYLPSGAVCGVDGVAAAKTGGLDEVTLVTTKPPKSLGRSDEKRSVVFEGNAREAVRLFPKNINVAACVSLAGIGFDKTKVEIVSDPVVTRINHKILAHGRFGRLRAEIENMPNPNNPKSSYMASLSAISILRRIVDPVQIG
ncbi:MAG: aspartate dehydrogenase [Thermoplasmata archaeon]|nr:MAG: aspartate dehydrogenase [Thermoplasmata archaeon]MCD6468409.1 aspartate dehydrogenase [Thermoplasmata archaeon]RLF28019.1 MAG: aspartate dehydrogenase [Thermoplasmata archaeon]